MNARTAGSGENSLYQRDLINLLSGNGYLDYAVSYAPWLAGTHNWNDCGSKLQGELLSWVHLLLLGKPVAADVFSPNAQCLLDGLVSQGVLIRQDSFVRSPTLCLVPYLGMWLWVQRPQRNPTIYLGHDTFGLLARLFPRRADRCLDLCSGPGTQAIYMARTAKSVLAVELNAVTAQVAELNRTLNDCEESLQIRIGNLFSALDASDGKFDLISANPPLLPFPEDAFYPFVGHGGNDGMAVTWKILEAAENWLLPQGEVIIIGTGLSDGSLPLCLERLEDLTRIGPKFSITMSVVGTVPFEPGSLTFEGFVQTASRNPGDVEALQNKLAELLSNAGASHLSYFAIRAKHDGQGRFTLIDLSDISARGLWFL